MHRLQQTFTTVFNQISGVFRQEQVKKPPSNEIMYQLGVQHQQNFENMMACGICLEPRLRMVTGQCQHRFCVQCIYDDKGVRKRGLERCPSCQLDGAFPMARPVIPEDMVEIQRALGIGACDVCGEEMWLRELSDHTSLCLRSPRPTTSQSHTSSGDSVRRSGRKKKKQKHCRQSKGGNEVMQLLGDFGHGVSTRSHTNSLGHLDSGKSSKRKRRSAARTKLRPY